MMGSSKKASIGNLKLKGRNILDIECHSYFEFGDIILVLDTLGNQVAVKAASIPDNPKRYKIDKNPVEKIEFVSDLSLIVLHTKAGIFYRDKYNEKIEGSEAWADHFLEPHTSLFFRMDEKGRWYDLQGHLLYSLFLIKDDVLCSVAQKKSKKSLFFKDQKLYMNPKNTMAQIGKLVYDKNLNLLKYHGEKITGLGQKNLVLDQNNSFHEVRIGLEKRGFIHEHTFEALTINGEEIVSFYSELKLENFTIFSFQGVQNKYTIIDSLQNVLVHHKKPLSIVSEELISIGDLKLVKVSDGEKSFFWNIMDNEPFDPLNEDDYIVHIESRPVSIGNHLLHNLSYSTRDFVYDAGRSNVFRLNNSDTVPESVSIVPDLGKYFFYAHLQGTKKLCTTKKMEVLQFGDQKTEIKALNNTQSQKLINAESTDGDSFVLDFRMGYENPALAKVGIYRITKVFGQPLGLGDLILQNIELETLGGSKKRVVNLNSPDLELFRLPPDLEAYSEQTEKSAFANNVVVQIDLEKEIKIEDRVFFNAKFLTFLNEPKAVVIQKENARPVQLDGLGHRNELVQRFDPISFSNKYYLSAHRLIKVDTLTEDLKPNTLIFSLNTMSSWLPFFDTYLPIFKNIIDFKNQKKWEYHLLELHNPSNEKEYVAVEQNPPYRILADKTRSKYKPRIVKSKEIVLKSPEEISTIRRFFSNPGELVEIG